VGSFAHFWLMYRISSANLVSSGTGITNVEYQKLPAGPAPRRLLPVRNEMVEKGELAIQEVSLKSGRTQKRTINLRNPKPELFGGQEIAMVDRVIEALREVDAQEISAMSHEMVGWMVVEEGEDIPYNTVYFPNPPLTDWEIYRAQELKREKTQAAGAEPVHAAA
jgi:Protein of unknown function (DUF4065)